MRRERRAVGETANALATTADLGATVSVPTGFLELEPPAVVDQSGKPISSASAHLAWDWPIFLRAVLVKPWGVSPFPDAHLKSWPGWRLYGGPMARWHYFEAKKFLEQWAFSQGYMVHAEMVPILPNQPPAPWPRTAFQWEYVYETAPPSRWRVAWQGLQGGKLVRVV